MIFFFMYGIVSAVMQVKLKRNSNNQEYKIEIRNGMKKNADSEQGNIFYWRIADACDFLCEL